MAWSAFDFSNRYASDWKGHRTVSWSDGRTLFGLVSMLDYAAAVTFVFGPVARAAADATMRVPGGVGGQLVLGALLGVVWTPCTGPALAAAIALAARSESLAHAGGVMFLFGLGTVTPLLALAYGSRRALAAGPWVTRLGAAGRTVIGSALVVVGVLALAGADKAVEAWLVDRMPSWLLDLTTLL